MQAMFTEEQEALAATVRDLARTGLVLARGTLTGEEISDPVTPQLFEGFGGVGVPEAAGGFGGGLVELAILMEGLGRAVVPTPFVTHVLALQTAISAGLDVGGAVQDGQRWTLAVEETGRAFDDPGASVQGGYAQGVKVSVRDGERCDVAVTTTVDGVVLAAPTERRPRQPLDTTRPLADLTFADAPARSGTRGDLRRAAALVAAETVGVGRGALDLAVAYANTREQFGQPIGRFQGVAHQLADVFVELEAAWSLVLYACWAVDDGHPKAAAATAAAKAKASTAAVYAAERSVQVHGGIGITWEADPHLFLRRAIADSGWLGPASEHQRRLGELTVANRR